MMIPRRESSRQTTLATAAISWIVWSSSAKNASPSPILSSSGAKKTCPAEAIFKQVSVLPTLRLRADGEPPNAPNVRPTPQIYAYPLKSTLSADGRSCSDTFKEDFGSLYMKFGSSDKIPTATSHRLEMHVKIVHWTQRIFVPDSGLRIRRRRTGIF